MFLSVHGLQFHWHFAENPWYLKLKGFPLLHTDFRFWNRYPSGIGKLFVPSRLHSGKRQSGICTMCRSLSPSRCTARRLRKPLSLPFLSCSSSLWYCRAQRKWYSHPPIPSSYLHPPPRRYPFPSLSPAPGKYRIISGSYISPHLWNAGLRHTGCDWISQWRAFGHRKEKTTERIIKKRE